MMEVGLGIWAVHLWTGLTQVGFTYISNAFSSLTKRRYTTHMAPVIVNITRAVMGRFRCGV